MSILDVFKRKASFEALQRAVEREPHVAENLIKRGDIDVRGKPPYMCECTLLHWYAASTEPEEQKKLPWVEWLLDHGADIEARDELARTPLLLALAPEAHGTPAQYFPTNPRIGLLLLERGASIDAKGHKGKTILHEHVRIAARNTRNADFVRLIIAMGADIFALDDDGKTPFEYLHHVDSYVVRNLGIQGKDYERVKTIMEQCGNAPSRW